MREKNVAFTIDYEISPRLSVVVFAITPKLPAFTQKFKVERERRWRKHPKPRKPLQSKGPVGDALRVSQNSERPVMILLILDEPRRLGEGNHDNRNPTPGKCIFARFHLAEVSLARESGKVP